MMECLNVEKNRIKNSLFAQDSIDHAASDELKIYFDNDQQFYRSRYIPWLKNFARKMKRGIYQHDLAVGGLQRNLVPDIIKGYDGIELRDVNRATRKDLAENITVSIEDEIKIDHKNNFDEVLKR